MKQAGIIVICFALLLAWNGVSRAQTPCDQIDQYSTDSVTTVDATGLPNDTVLVPLYVVNEANIGALQVYMEFDSTTIKPLVLSVDMVIDTSYFINVYDSVTAEGDTITVYDTTGSIIDTLITTDYQYTLTDRFDDTWTSLRVVDETDYPAIVSGWHRIKIIAYPWDYLNIHPPAVDSGSGEILLIPFEISGSASVGTSTPIQYWDTTIYNDSTPPQQVGCIFSQFYDTTGTPVHRLQTKVGYVNIDEPPDIPTINSFVASPDTIQQGESTTLMWDVSNATSISINPTVGAVTDSIGSAQVSPGATTTYTLTATNADGSAYASAKVTVVPYVENNRPVFTEPIQTSYEIEQGQTLAFQVTATDADNDNLTLTATSLPNNATFGPTNPVTGVGSVTGNFSFTPDYSLDGTYQVNFTAEDGKVGGTAQLTVSILVKPIEYDRLFTTSAEGQLPVGGLPGAQTILVPINLVTSQTVYGVQFDFLYDEQHFEVDSIITTPRTENFVIYENIGQLPGEIRVITFGVGNEPITIDTASTAILYVVMSIDTSAEPGDYPILIENGWESTNPNPDYPSLPLVTDSGIIQVDRLGDVNLDKRVDVADAVNVVGYILGNFGLSSRQFAAADVVVDGTVNVLDLVGIINLIFGIPPSPVAGHFIDGDIATVALDYPDLPGGAVDIMVVRSELPAQIAGVQLEIRYDPSSLTLGRPTLGNDAEKMVLSSSDHGDGKLTVLLYFKNPFRIQDLIQEGEADLLNIPIIARADIEYGNESQMKLTGALLSTASAEAVRVEGIDPALPISFVLHQNYPNPFNPTTTIEFSLGATTDGSLTQHVNLDIYNILGQHVKTLVDENLVPGNYRIDWDATSRSGQRVASGIYLYKLQVGQESKSKKMLFLK